MTSDLTEAKPPSAGSNEDAEALLDTANRGSQHVAVWHVAFMALCAYVLVIVFGTTDMDLLIGKGVKLPVVDVTVPIVGFYWFVPYLVILVHFNLLLQLQLLSRQLYAFDAAAPEQERIGGLRDRLHIFPYTYYLVGRAGPIVRRLLGIVVGITLLVLPLATLLVLQLRFLAYQDQTVTWAQRVAVWCDVALVIVLWPVIMDPGDSWRAYLRRLVTRLRQRWRIGLAWAVVWGGIVFMTSVRTTPRDVSNSACFETGKNTVLIKAMPAPRYVGYFAALQAILGLLILLGVASGLARLWRRWRGRRRKPQGTGPARTAAVRGMPGLLLVVALGVPLPLGLFALGEWWEEELLTGNVVDSGLMIYDRLRFLDLSEQVLLAKPAKPELIAQFREGNPEKVKEALKQMAPVNLQGRNLRQANLIGALLPGADLRGAKLQDACLWGANLQGADLDEAQLQGAGLQGANLQGADLTNAELQAADLQRAKLQGASLGAAKLQEARLYEARLQGANLRLAKLQSAYMRNARLQGADLTNAELQAADLQRANLQGADLTDAELQAADLQRANLQGADLTDAELQGADLRFAKLYGVIVETSGTALVDLRAASWTPLHEERLAGIRKVLGKRVADRNLREKALDRIERAGHADLAPPTLESCLIDPEVTPELNCEQKWLPAEKEAFQRELFPVLEKLACHSAEIAQGLRTQTECCEYGDARDTTSGRFGLAGRFAALLDKRECEVLSSLPEGDKGRMRIFATQEDELRGQSSAGKPMKEAPAPPTPPPANAPATP